MPTLRWMSQTDRHYHFFMGTPGMECGGGGDVWDSGSSVRMKTSCFERAISIFSASKRLWIDVYRSLIAVVRPSSFGRKARRTNVRPPLISSNVAEGAGSFSRLG